MQNNTRFLFSFLLSIIPFFLFATSPQIHGVVLDQTTKEPIIGAAIILEGTTIGTTTDFDGNYSLSNIPTGTYTIKVQYISYMPSIIPDVYVEVNSSLFLEVLMKEDNIMLADVVVVAQAKRNTDLSMIKAQKASLTVSSGVSAQQISKTQDRDASEVIKRVPGISIIDDKFVMVRGLSQRYNNVWINNGAVPSSEADSRAFSFDIIPSSQMDNLTIIKVPVPNLSCAVFL